LARLTFAAELNENDKTKDAMVPVVLASATGYTPDIPSLQAYSKAHPEKGQTIWLHLHNNIELRKRVIVLLDAVDLRKFVSISTGVSWERTVQDTILEFERNPRLSALAEFGHVIVRFGVTGLLLITRTGNDKSYSLFFDPMRHDSEVVAGTGDETVRG